MKHQYFSAAIVFTVSCLFVSGQTPPAHAVVPTPAQSAAPAQNGNTEQQELQKSVQEAGASVVDFVRALEQHLAKYPNSSLRQNIDAALFRAAKEMKDNRRIAKYGERMLSYDPNDVSVLDDTGKALVTFGDPNLAKKALEYGKKLEQLANQNHPAPANETDREKGKRIFERDRQIADSLLIQANAAGTIGNVHDAVTLAKKSFDTSMSADAARAAGHWLAQAGQQDEAVSYYADAFALGDSPQVHAQDRRTMSEIYLRTHPNEKGLGDIVLNAYDRMNSLMSQRNERFGNTNTTRPIDFRLTSLNGKTLPLETLKGKVIVMDFWATWCGPCRQQHPLYEQVKEQFKNDARVAFLEVNSDEDHSLVEPFLAKEKWNKDVYFEDGLAQVLRIDSIPTTVLLGQDGSVYSKMVGFNPGGFVSLLTSRIHEALGSTTQSN